MGNRDLRPLAHVVIDVGRREPVGVPRPCARRYCSRSRVTALSGAALVDALAADARADDFHDVLTLTAYPLPSKCLDSKERACQQVGTVPVGQPGSKERVDFGKEIGNYVDPVTGESTPTTVGIIHYGSRGAHIVPARPKQ